MVREISSTRVDLIQCMSRTTSYWLSNIKRTRRSLFSLQQFEFYTLVKSYVLEWLDLKHCIKIDVSQSPNFHERHAAGALTYSISKAFSSSLAKLASRNRHNHGWVLQSSTTTIQYQQELPIMGRLLQFYQLGLYDYPKFISWLTKVLQ